MDDHQKGTILTLLKVDETDRDHRKDYWFSYKDFLDPTDPFTEFACECLEGKQRYITLIEDLICLDETAEIFVQVYGYENDGDEQFIYADTLIIFSRLPVGKVRQVFNGPKDIFPSDIGEVTDLSRPTFLISGHGGLIQISMPSDKEHFIYYCWWD